MKSTTVESPELGSDRSLRDSVGDNIEEDTERRRSELKKSLNATIMAKKPALTRQQSESDKLSVTFKDTDKPPAMSPKKLRFCRLQ